MFDELEFSHSLGSDNHSGVHPRVFEALQAANRGHAHAYGMDELCRLTEREFQRVFGPEVEAQYVFTGTAANVLALAPSLRSHEAVICAGPSHLNQDECAAPEKFWGGKLWPLPSTDGRIHPEQCAPLLQRRGDQHFAQPRAVSLTLPTEFGVCYRLEELRAWRRFAREKNLMLHLDGARLANAAAFLNLSPRELINESGADVVSFGGTKNGLMGAEAVLLFTPAAKADFKFQRKQAMQLSSKTRFLAAQFHAYLKNDLWLEIARHAVTTARDLKERLAEIPEIEILFPVESNALWMISWDWTTSLNEKWIQHIREVKACFPVIK
jgi:threonine aldolase